MKVIVSITFFLSLLMSFGQQKTDTLYKFFPKDSCGLLARATFEITILASGKPFVLSNESQIINGVSVKTVPDSIPVGESGKLVVYVNRRLNENEVVLLRVVEKYNTPSTHLVKLTFEQEKEVRQEENRVASVIVKGKVFDAQTNHSLVGEIEIIDMKSNEEVIFSTNSNGEFETSSLSIATDYVVQVGAPHCKVQLDTIRGSELTELVFSKDYYLERMQEGDVIPLEDVLFKVGTSEMLPTSFTTLDGVVMMMKLNPTMKIRIDGHTDNSASKSSSIKLSTQRAEAVKKYLIKNKVSQKQVATKGAGATHPVVPNTSEENRKKNRRVEFVVLKI